MSKEKHIEVLTSQGEKVAYFIIRVSDEAPLKNGSSHKNQGNYNASKPGNGKNGESMTDAQKKYLFRIFASQGVEGEEAHDRLKNLFGVDTLKEVSKFEASKMIESLLAEAKGGNDNGSPF